MLKTGNNRYLVIFAISNKQVYKSSRAYMAGVYIHIPFCKKACHYCNFHFSASKDLKDEFIAALLHEIELQKDYLSEAVSTVYFGGGTPSLLPATDIKNIISSLAKKLYN